MVCIWADVSPREDVIHESPARTLQRRVSATERSNERTKRTGRKKPRTLAGCTRPILVAGRRCCESHLRCLTCDVRVTVTVKVAGISVAGAVILVVETDATEICFDDPPLNREQLRASCTVLTTQPPILCRTENEQWLTWRGLRDKNLAQTTEVMVSN